MEHTRGSERLSTTTGRRHAVQRCRELRAEDLHAERDCTASCRDLREYDVLQETESVRAAGSGVRMLGQSAGYPAVSSASRARACSIVSTRPSTCISYAPALSGILWPCSTAWPWARRALARSSMSTMSLLYKSLAHLWRDQEEVESRSTAGPWMRRLSHVATFRRGKALRAKAAV